MINTVYISTQEEIFELIFDQTYDKDIQRHRSGFLYRGMPNVNYTLATSLQRNCKEKGDLLEKPILRNFTKYAAIEDSKLKESVWRQMIIGQHHGLPTRLLDWTYSPMMGLHFATSGDNLDFMDTYDSVLWKIDIIEMNQMLPAKYQEKLREERAYLFTVDMLDSLVNTIDTYDHDMKDDAMILLEPPSIDQRIINQYAYFSLTPKGVDNIEAFLDSRTMKTTKYIIDKRLKWRIRDMLDQMNINERIAYPGLDGITTWIKRRYYVKS